MTGEVIVTRTHSYAGEQASKFSLYAPIVALVLGFLTINNRQGGAGVFIAWTNVGLAVSGLCLGLFSLTKLGASNRNCILVRALIGIILNGLIVVGVVMILNMASTTLTIHDRIVGHWRVTKSVVRNTGQTSVTYRPDGTCELVQTSAEGRSGKATGNWLLEAAGHHLLITIRHGDGDASLAGKTLNLGRVKSVDDSQMVLDTGAGDEISQRIP